MILSIHFSIKEKLLFMVDFSFMPGYKIYPERGVRNYSFAAIR